MRQPFQRHDDEYWQAIRDYGRVLEPVVLDEIIERCLEQYPNSPLSFGLLVDMKVLKNIQDDIDWMMGCY